MATLTCTKCGKVESHRVVYAYPSAEAIAQSERGEIVLAGCELGEPVRNWRCADCKERFAESRDTVSGRRDS